MSKNGFVKINRKITEWEWYKNVPTRVLFEHLIYTVNYEDKMWQGRKILRGQKVTSIKHLAEETGLTLRQVRTALNNLKTTCEVTSETTNKFTVVTVVNYEVYQNRKSKTTSKTTSNLTNERQTNDNNIRNIRNKEGRNIFPLPNFSESGLDKLYDN